LIAALALLLLAAPAPPEIQVRTGVPIRLDGRVDEAEWADAFSISRDRPGGGTVRFRLKRTGPWLALGLDADGPYRGEVLHLYVSDAAGPWITKVVLGLGQPVLPPALWRRGTRTSIGDPDGGPGDTPRACLTRVNVEDPGRWSGEVLLRLGALGIGRGDLRDLRGLVALQENAPIAREVFTLPGGLKDPLDPSQYARLVSPDGWGSTETWPPVTPEQTKEFDDAALLYRLCLEHDRVTQRETPEELVIASAVKPRSMSRINALRQQLEAGRARNPSLPAWPYFLGWLFHESNLYDEAGKIIESVPGPVRALPAFASLAAQHYLDTERFDLAEQVCNECPYMPRQEAILKLAVQGKRLQDEERAAVEKDAAKAEKNPRIALHTSKGTIVIELFEDDAPGAVRNLMDLVLRRHFYDGLRFHDVSGAGVAMVGDPRTRLGSTETRPGPGWRIRRDPSKRALLRGYVAAFPLKDDTAHGSIFMIALAPLMEEMSKTFVFGRVVEGMDVLMSLEQDDLLERVEVLSQRNHQYDASGVRLDR